MGAWELCGPHWHCSAGDLLSLSFCLFRACSVVSDPLHPADCSLPGSSGVGCHFLLQGIFPTQGLSPHLLCLLLWQVDSFTAEPPGKPLSLRSGEILTPCWASSDPSSRKWEQTQVEVEFQASVLPSRWEESKSELLASSGRKEEGPLITAWQGRKSGPRSASAGQASFPRVWQEHSSHCLTVSALLGCSCLHPWLETAGFHGGLFCLCLLVFPGCWLR